MKLLYYNIQLAFKKAENNFMFKYNSSKRFWNSLFIKFFCCFCLSLLVLSSIYGQNPCVKIEKEFGTIINNNELNSIEQAEKLYEEYIKESCANMVIANNFMGNAHYNFSNIDQSKKYLFLAEKEFLANPGNPINYATNQLYTGLTFIIQKNYEAALEKFQTALEYANDTDELNIKSSIYQNLALVKIHQNKLEEAEIDFNKSIETGGLDSISTAYIYQNLAFLYLKQENKEKTLEYIYLTKTLWNQLDNNKGLYLLSFIETKLSILDEDYKKALKLLLKGRSVFENKEKLLLGENYLLEAKLQRLTGNIKAERAALEYGLLNSVDLTGNEITDAINELAKLQTKGESVTILTEIISKLKNQITTQQDLYTSETKLKDSEIKQGKSIIQRQLFSILFLVGGLLGLLYLFVKNRYQKTKIMSLNEDLSESQIKLERQLNEVNQRNEELENFAYVASHDLKSPLNTVNSFSQLIKRHINNNDKIEIYLGYIQQAVEDMSNLIQDLLLHSTIVDNFNPEISNAAEIIENSVHLLSKNIEDSKAEITIDKGSNPQIFCEKNQIGVVIQNLIANAINYSKDNVIPKIDISIKENSKEVIFHVKDNGIGISDEYKDTIFQMFKRLKVKKTSGTGIGLATCKKIMDRHQGTIIVESKENEGSTFIVTLPKDV